MAREACVGAPRVGAEEHHRLDCGYRIAIGDESVCGRFGIEEIQDVYQNP